MHDPRPGLGMWRTALIVLLIFGLAIRIHAILNWKAGLSNDESVTYMCAAATAGEWERSIAGMVGEPIVVADIQRFYDRPATLEFHTVALDMAMYDVHPPLYFWLLHIIHVFWGTSIITGALLNTGFGVLLALLVHRLALRTLREQHLALAATVIWYLSPAVVQIDLEARPYQLLALLAITSLLLQQDLLRGTAGMWRWTAFTVVNVLGLLTHLYYGFLLIPFAVATLWLHGWGAATRHVAASFLLSFAAMLALYPEFLQFLSTFGDRPRDVPEPVAHIDRMKGVVFASLRFFSEQRLLRYLFLALCIGFGAWVLMRALRSKGADRAWIEHRFLWSVLVWWGGFTVAFYLLGVSPAQAVGEQYFAYIWPLVAIGCVFVVHRSLPQRFSIRDMVFALYLAQLVIAFCLAVRGSDYLKTPLPDAWYAKLRGCDRLITDEAKRTALPRIARDLPSELPLFILGRAKPLPIGEREPCFLHLALKDRPAVDLVDWMRTHGYAQSGTVLTHDRYELRSFTR